MSGLATYGSNLSYPRFHAEAAAVPRPVPEPAPVSLDPPSLSKHGFRNFVAHATAGKTGGQVHSMPDLARMWRDMSQADKARYVDAAPLPSRAKPRRRQDALPPIPAERTPFALGDDSYPLAHDRIQDLVTGAPHSKSQGEERGIF